MKSVDKMENQTPENCVVTYAASPSKFYIATPEMRAEEEQIAESMSKEFNRATPMKSGEQLIAADLIVVYHRGKFWRALKLKNAQGISLFLVDRGEVVVVADLKVVFALDLDHSLREIDPLCVRAHLGDVLPNRARRARAESRSTIRRISNTIDIPWKRAEWSVESIDFFERNIRHGCQMAIARFLDHTYVFALRASGLWLRYATLQNLISSFPWIAHPCPPTWRNQRREGIKFCHLATLTSGEKT